jgi:hypothetical protein
MINWLENIKILNAPKKLHFGIDVEIMAYKDNFGSIKEIWIQVPSCE